MDDGESPAVFDFGRLIEPVTKVGFFEQYWDHEPLVLNRKSSDLYADLLDLEAVDREIASDPVRLTSVDAGIGKPREASHLDDDGTIFVERALQGLGEGGTLVLDRLDRRIPPLNRFCRALEQDLNYRLHANVYVTAPGGRGFPPHYDTTNIFVLQIHGSKSWRVGRNRVAAPAAADPLDSSLCDLSADPKAFSLEAGDLAFLPRGFVHQAEAGAMGSLHVTLTVGAPSWAEVAGLTADVGRGDGAALGLHELLPPGFLELDQAQLASWLLKRLPSLSSLESAGRAVERFTTGWVRQHRPDLTGRLVDLLRGNEIDAERPVGPRPGLIYRIQGDGPDLELICGRVVMRFDERIRTAMLYCLETEHYRPRDLPAPLAQAEKLELVSSLTQAGLVMRRQKD